MMKNELAPGRRLAIGLIILAGVNSRSFATAQDQPPAKDSVYVAATVLGEDIRLRVVKPSEVARNRAKLSEKDFARWQSESRWRRLVNKVSHLVMSDWAKQNDVRPTRAEIQEHFRNEARQHLQAYATPEGTKQVAVAMMWGTASAVEWVRTKALHEKYGGPIAISSFGGCIAI